MVGLSRSSQLSGLAALLVETVDGSKQGSAPKANIGKELAPYTIAKHSNPQNRAKIHQKYSKNRIWGIFGVFLPYFASGGNSYSLGGQLFPKANMYARPPF